MDWVMATRRRVFRVLVAYGGRPHSREYTFQASSVRHAMTCALRRARVDELARPHEIAAVLHLFDLDQLPRAPPPARRPRRTS